MKRIAIHSVPRSGSSWIGQIFNSAHMVNFKFQPLFSYEFKDYLDENSKKEDIQQFFREIAKCNSDFLLQKDKVEKGIYPLFNKADNFTHIVYKEVRYHHILENMLSEDSEIIVIGIARNPFSVINSFLQSPKEFRKDLGWKENEEWQFSEKKNLNKKEEFYGFEKWKEVALLFDDLSKKYPDRFYLINYDDVISNTEKIIQEVFQLCDISYTEQTRKFINNSKTLNKSDTYSVYRNKKTDNGWIKSLKPNIALAINDELKKSNNLSKYKLTEDEIKTLQ